MLMLDHLSIIAPSLEEGIAHVSSVLGIDLVNGTTHSDMGTHNRRVVLGRDRYLEVIAADPAAPVRGGPRWFGLDQFDAVRARWSEGSRLRGWVARTDDIDGVLRRCGPLLGSRRWLDGHFAFSVPPDGELPMGGVLPSVIDLAGQPPTARTLVDQGLRLRRITLEHPDPAAVSRLYGEIGVVDPPTVVEGEGIALIAEIETGRGVVHLR